MTRSTRQTAKHWTNLDDKMTEKELQATIVQAARTCGWRVYHTYDSRKSEPGFPDLVLVRDGDLLFVELKSTGGQLSADQELWLAALDRTGADVRVWRPADLDTAIARLKPIRKGH